jgi:WD40-like Beta Propeller Repeat
MLVPDLAATNAAAAGRSEMEDRMMGHRTRRIGGLAGLTGVLLISASTMVAAAHYGSWAVAVSAESIPGTSSELNTPFLDGCPIQSPDGLSLYMASNRPGGQGGIDIWVAHRASRGQPFGAPVNLGPEINSGADDFCPTPVPGHGLFFVSTRAVAGACGGADIYFARFSRSHGWTTPENLGCDVNGPAGEAGPSLFETDEGEYLYFSSGPDIYSSRRNLDGSFQARVPVAELNSASADLRPNVRRNGLEVVFDSDRPGTLGMADLWIATRDCTCQPWSTPVNLGPSVNTAVNETRGSFSRDGATLYFGRAPGPEGGSDIFVTTRTKVHGAD